MMNDKDKIIAKIKESAYENVNKKMEEERKRVERVINNEVKDVERCLKYIENKMVYKIIKTNRYTTKEYRLADENTFFEDYNKELEYEWQRGIKFRDPSKNPARPLFEVNREDYYDIRYIINHYEERVNDYTRKLNSLNNQFEEIKEKADKLLEQELYIKKLIEQYKQVDIDETYLKDLEEDW